MILAELFEAMGEKPYVTHQTLLSPNSVAYWISPRGEIFDTDGKTHIYMVCEHPEKFGLTPQMVMTIYVRHGEEPIGMEGNAREEIIQRLVDRGWIRIRLYPSRDQDYWSVTTAKLTSRVKESLFSWANWLLEQSGNIRWPERPVRLLEWRLKKMHHLTVQEMAQDALLDEAARKVARPLILLESIEQLEPVQF